MASIVIKEYDPLYQEGINLMMRTIEAEFAEAITGPQSTIIKEVYQLPGQKFWVALHNKEVVGTIGMVLKENLFAEVKRMMEWTLQQGIKTVYLGTMNQFKAAQRFYEKQGFISIPPSLLPKEYKINPIDTLFYKRELY
jgi:hypothetical protein